MELIRFNEQHRDREMPFFGQETFERAESLGGLDSPAYQAALAKCRELSRRQGIDATMDKHRLDAIVLVTQGPPTLIDLVNGDYSSGGGNTSLAAMAGYPSLTVPAGYVFGLPVGLSFIGRAWSEGALIRLAYAYEQATNVGRPPRFLPTAEIGYAKTPRCAKMRQGKVFSVGAPWRSSRALRNDERSSHDRVFRDFGGPTVAPTIGRIPEGGIP